MSPLDGPILQYGALGIALLLATIAVRVLFQREVEATTRLEKALEVERARSDRLETELRQLNAAIQDRYLRTLSEATHAIADAMALTRSRLER